MSERTLTAITLLLWLAVIIAALVQVGVVHWQRGLLAQWQQQDQLRSKQQQEYTRLLLEKSALTAHGRIESQARAQLLMTDPARIEVVGSEPIPALLNIGATDQEVRR